MRNKLSNFALLLSEHYIKNVLSVFHYFLVTQMSDRSQTSKGLSVYRHVYGGLHKVFYTASNWFVSKNQICNVPLTNTSQRQYLFSFTCSADRHTTT